MIYFISFILLYIRYNLMIETSFSQSNFSQTNYKVFQLMTYPTDNPQHISYFTNQCGYCKGKIYPKIDAIFMYKCVIFTKSFALVISPQFVLKVCYCIIKYTEMLLFVRKNVGKNSRRLTKKREETTAEKTKDRQCWWDFIYNILLVNIIIQ